QISAQFRWSSFSSRVYDPAGPDHEYLSSLRGNRPYDYFSLWGINSFRNYAFGITDPDVFPGYGTKVPPYNGVREARFYFATPVRDDSELNPAAFPSDTDVLGKTELLFHRSVSSDHVSSAGCVVSPVFEEMRTELIRHYQNEHFSYYG